jgi:hypothetical protein
MTDWLSYRPSDFLMFSPRVYARLFELVNDAWWPWHGVIGLLGLLGLVALVRGRGRVAVGVGLGAAWLLCTVVFVVARYEPIHWAVGYGVPALLLLALLLPLLAWQRRHGPAAACGAAMASLVLGAWALVGQPLLAPLAGQPWAQAEVLALAPDPTAIATLAWLVTLPRATTARSRALGLLAWALVLAWLAFTAFMLMTMERWQALVPLAAAALAVGTRVRKSRAADARRAGRG